MNETTLEKSPVRPYCWNCGADPAGRRLLTISEAAGYCGVSANSIYRWMERVRVEWVLTAGRKRRIYRDSLASPGGSGSGSELESKRNMETAEGEE
jgi:excisionase family DNA binding protein